MSRKPDVIGGLYVFEGFPIVKLLGRRHGEGVECNILPYFNGDKVLQRFAHLESFNMQMPCVNEVIDPGSAIVVRLEELVQSSLVQRETLCVPPPEPFHYHGEGRPSRYLRNEYPCCHPKLH